MDSKVISAGQTECDGDPDTCCAAWCAARSDCVAATEEDNGDSSITCRRYRTCALASEVGAKTYTKCDGPAPRYSQATQPTPSGLF